VTALGASVWVPASADHRRPPEDTMIIGLIALLSCQLVGEFAVRVLSVPIPGPVVGMLLLFIVLQLRRPGPAAGVVRAADLLLRHLQLLFIPAGAGVVLYLSLLAGSWLPVVGGLLLSWLAVLVVTAGVGVGTLSLERRFRGSGGETAP
jgi:holin-like protein